MHLMAYQALLWGCCAFAIWKGGAPERICAVAMLVASKATHYTIMLQGDRYAALQMGALTVDVALFALFYWLSIRTERYWPMWISSMQLVAVVSHLATKAMQPFVPWAYAVAIACWSYPMLLMVAWGAVRHQERVRRHSYDPSWIRDNA